MWWTVIQHHHVHVHAFSHVISDLILFSPLRELSISSSVSSMPKQDRAQIMRCMETVSEQRSVLHVVHCICTESGCPVSSDITLL